MMTILTTADADDAASNVRVPGASWVGVCTGGRVVPLRLDDEREAMRYANQVAETVLVHFSACALGSVSD